MTTGGRSSIRRGAAIWFTVLAIVSAGCGNPNKGDSVAVIGDSITVFDQTELQSRLGRDFELVVSGSTGYTIAEVMPEAQFVASRTYDQVIINMGSNDVLNGLDVDQSMSDLVAIIALFDSASCLHLVNVNEHMINLTTTSFTTTAARTFNAALADLVVGDGRLSIIDWAAVTDDNLNDDEPPWSTLTEDSIHPTEEGNRVLHGLYDDALASC